MLKTRKLISLVLVVAMMLSVFSVAIVSTGAAEAVESATIVYDGQTVNAHVGDTIRYKAYMDVTPISTASDGYVNGVNAVTYYTQSNLTISGTLGRKNFPNLYAPTIGTDVEGAIYYNDVDIDEGFKYDADSPVLIDVTFEITQGGTSTITNNIIELYKAENNVPKYFYYAEGEKLIDETPNFWSTLEVTCPHPDEPTVAPTDAPTPGDKLTVTVVSLDGVEDTKTFDIGETFTVYTTLNTSAYENGGISALNGSQSYKVDFLEFADKYDSDTGDILNPEEVFPVVGDDMVANGKTPGTIKFNASTISLKNPYRFDDNNDILVKTQYKVKAPGETRIVTEMLTLAIADQPLTKIINHGEIQDGYEDFRMHSSFTWPEENPTEAPTDAPVPTEAPTDAPVPTEAPTDAPVPTEAPTEAPKPTEAPVGKATVTVSGLDGESETKEFNVGDSFTVYTTLNTSAYENGGIDAIDGSQTYTASVLSLVDEYDPEGGEILNPADMFPVTGDDMIANGKTSGKITFNASQASIKDPYRFGSDASVLIQSHYTVTAPGTAEIKTTLKTLAIADEPLTKIIDQGEIQDGYKNFRLHSSFIEPALQPTTAPTEAPKPTETPVTITDGYYLVGTMTDWKADPAYKFSENTANPGEYMLSTTLAATDGIKALKVENGAITAWYPNGMGDEYNVDAAHAGDVTVYFKPTYQSDWSAFGGYLYIDGGSAPTPDMITVKFTNTNNWGAVYAYCWYEDGNEPLGGWSGTLMTKESGNIYSVQIPANTYGLIFNDGNTYQTVDIGDGITDGAHWKLSGQMDGTNYKVALVTDTPEPTTAPEPSKNYVYLAPAIWDVADATERFQLYIWNDGGDELWLTGTLVGGKYQFEIPTGFTDGTFVRMDSAKPVDEWGSMWNQTVDVTLNIGKTYTIDSWDVDQGKSGGSWS